MQVPITPNLMKLDSYVMEENIIVNMVDSFLVGTRKCWWNMVTVYYFWLNWPLMAHPLLLRSVSIVGL